MSSKRYFLGSFAATFVLVSLMAAPRAAMAQQTLYVVDSGTTVYKIAPDGTQTTFASGLGAVGPLVSDAAGNVYAGYASASGYGGGIYRIAPDGTQGSYTGYPVIANVTGLAFDANGYLFEAEYGTDSNNNSTIHKITQAGVASVFAQVAGSQRNLAFDPTGNLFVADTALGSVTKIAPDGTESTFASGLSSPYGLAFDPSGNLYVSNYGNGSGTTITKITPAGVQSTFAIGLSGPAGLAFDQSGNLFVSNYTGGSITEITPTGAKSTFATGFTNPAGLLFSAPTAPVVTSAPRSTAAVGTAFSYQITANNNPASYSAVGLPAELSLNTASGIISGTPTAGGAYTVSLFSTNVYGTGSSILTLAITPGVLQQTLYVADDGTNLIMTVAPDGTQTEFAALTGDDSNLVFDASGNLFAGTGSASGYGGNVLRYAPDGTVTNFIASVADGSSNVNEAGSLAFDGSGNLFEADNDGDATHPAIIHEITPGGVVSNYATLEYGLSGLVVDGAGNLFVGDQGLDTIVKIAPGGAQTTFATGLDVPEKMVFDAAGNLYVSNFANGTGLTVTKITPDGTESTYATGFQAPTGLAFDAAGNLFVANYATHGGGTITEVTPAGARATYATGFTNPNGIVFSALPVPVITSATRASVTAGTAFSYQIVASYTPTSYNASGLPTGLTVDPASGLISGTTSQVGTFTVSLYAVNAAGTGSGILTLTVNATGTSSPTPTPTPTGGFQPTISITSPPDGITLTVGEDLPLAASVTDPDGLASQVRFTVGSALVDSATAAPYTFDAIAPTAPGQYAIQATVVDSTGRTNSASINVNVIAATASAPPTSILLTPISGRDLAAGSTVTLSFTATITATTALDHVTLYADGVIVANLDASGNPITTSSTDAPPTRRDATPLPNFFQTSYTLPAADKIVSLISVAVDKLGQSAISKVASVHAKVTTDKAPVVAFGSFANNNHVRVASTNTVSVTASDPDAAASSAAVHTADAASDGTLALLEYYLNGNKIGEGMQAPYRFTFTPPAAGKYILHAVATDGSGLASVTEPVVIEADPAPTVNLALGGNGTAFEGGANGIVLVTRTGDTTSPLTVSYKAKGSAAAGVDYKKLSGSVTIPAGAVKAKIKIKPIDGSPNDGTLKIKIQLLSPTDGSYVPGTSAVKIKLIGE